MARYLSKHRIESPIWLEPNDVSFLRTRLSKTETKVESLENQISEMTRQRNAKLVEIASFRNILAPVRRIPLEIISEIFELALCLPNENIFWSANYNFARKMFVICGVCVAWRKVAHGTPRIWRKLCLNRRQHLITVERGVGYIDDWIARSQSLPLDLYLSISTQNNARQLLIYIPFGRIRLLHLSGNPSSYVPIFQLPSSSLPLLEELFFDIVDSKGDPVSRLKARLPENMEVLLTAPKLQHVEIQLDDSSILGPLRLPVPTDVAEDFESQWKPRSKFLFGFMWGFATAVWQKSGSTYQLTNNALSGFIYVEVAHSLLPRSEWWENLILLYYASP
ncbi:hypothetical protein BT96DRAFT_975687 [Gymnopus androsaceus JB14]|uniref:Uncharacterized protein n=1 Tax=Gymnopus androsaceus JB14 TaxID=1447944 RepID=A0A6A4HMY0_9AGAR|nr:hypothetical protein BT96DRAFT_975687 [Gymnopus androsaceus JB14]